MSSELTPQDLEHFSGQLREILRRATGTADRIEGESLDTEEGGRDTQGDAGADQKLEKVDLDSLEVEVGTAAAAVAALKRISDGTYGRCTKCDDWIPRSRLEVVPSAPLCVPCQEASEEKEGDDTATRKGA